ncbi:MAG: hypothetical protein AAF939_21295 [Planctomycetota bacterium]
MKIELPLEYVSLIQKKAAEAGFGGKISAYIVHLVEADVIEDFGGPEHLAFGEITNFELDRMIDAGFDSGPASPMAKSDWRELHKRIDGRQANS